MIRPFAAADRQLSVAAKTIASLIHAVTAVGRAGNESLDAHHT
jgi:hypothetical protein